MMCAEMIFLQSTQQSFITVDSYFKPSIYLTINLSILVCYIFQAAFGCCAHQTMVRICFFNVFLCKNAEKGRKARNLMKNLANFVLKFVPERWSRDDPALLRVFVLNLHQAQCMDFLHHVTIQINNSFLFRTNNYLPLS